MSVLKTCCFVTLNPASHPNPILVKYIQVGPPYRNNLKYGRGVLSVKHLPLLTCQVDSVLWGINDNP